MFFIAVLNAPENTTQSPALTVWCETGHDLEARDIVAMYVPKLCKASRNKCLVSHLCPHLFQGLRKRSMLH